MCEGLRLGKSECACHVARATRTLGAVAAADETNYVQRGCKKTLRGFLLFLFSRRGLNPWPAAHKTTALTN